MPRFFFDVVTTTGDKIRDFHGLDFDDLDAAVADAVEGIQETVAAKAEEETPLEFKTLEILNGEGKVLAALPFLRDGSKPVH